MGAYDRAALRLALNAKCATVTGIKRAHPYVIEKVEETPCTYVSGFDDVTFNTTYGRGKTLTSFVVIVVCGRLDSEASQQTMDLLCSNLPLGDPDDSDAPAPVTFKDALESEQDLGGLCQTVLVRSAGNARAVTIAAQEYLAVDLNVEIRT